MAPSVTRRVLLGSTVGGLAMRPTLDFADDTTPARPPSSPTPQQSDRLDIVLQINGSSVPLSVDLRTSLLDALREYAGLTGTKKGCDRGACGACTVHVDGRRVLSCLTLAGRCQGKGGTPIEGLAAGTPPPPGQGGFLPHYGFPCGFCTPRPSHVGGAGV